MTAAKDILSLQKDFFNNLEKKGRSANTLKNYRTDLHCFNQYIEKQASKLSVAQLDIKSVQAYGQYLEARYNSDNSKRRRVQALRLFFDYLIETKIVDSNPVRSIPSSPKFLDIPRPTPLVDLKTLWQYLLEEGHSTQKMNRLLAKRNQVIVLLIYSGALKVSDISQLKVDSITLPDSPEEDPRVLVSPPKRDSYTIPLCQAFVPVYQDYLSELRARQQEQDIEFDHILFNANPYRILAGGLSSRGLEIVFEEWRSKLMVTITPKSLRQACVFRWLHGHNSDGLIKEWMGVAPSYSLKLYKEHLNNHAYNDTFLLELYHHYKTKDYGRN
jgi:site-specific recombinase XerD